MKFLGLCGSLREKSLNAAVMRACGDLVPESVTLERFEGLGDIPAYDEDVRADGLPAPVVALRDAITAADALLIVSPEYNYSIPGFLKNAIDWASRPPDQPFSRKSVGIMGASMGMIGTARMQYHLRQVFVFLDGVVLNRPEVFVGAAHQKVDEAGRLTDEPTREIIGQFLEALAEQTRIPAAAEAS